MRPLLCVGMLLVGMVEPTQGQTRKDAIVAALQEPFANDRAFQGVPLEQALEVMGLRMGVTILVDEESFRAIVPDVSIRQEPVSLPQLEGVSFHSALKLLLDPIDASIWVERDYLEIIPRWEAYRRVGLVDEFQPPAPPGEKNTDEATTEEEAIRLPWLELCHPQASGEMLSDVFVNLGAESGANIVLAPFIEELAQMPIETKMYNVQPSTAVHVFAEMAGLGVIEKDNVFLITTPEHAREWRHGKVGNAEVEVLWESLVP